MARLEERLIPVLASTSSSLHMVTWRVRRSPDVIIVFTGHLLGVVWLHGVAGGGADTRVAHAVQVLATQTLRTENLSKILSYCLCSMFILSTTFSLSIYYLCAYLNLRKQETICMSSSKSMRFRHFRESY